MRNIKTKKKEPISFWRAMNCRYGVSHPLSEEREKIMGVQYWVGPSGHKKQRSFKVRKKKDGKDLGGEKSLHREGKTKL